jgi:glycosyltransferase involved in cell wall biosynthesis
VLHRDAGEQAALLGETLDSVQTQTFADYEVVVVDDGSPVDVAALANGRDRTIVIRQRNAGPASARNTGIARSSGR